MLGDGNRHEVNFTVSVSKSLLVHALDQFHFVHESLEGVSPAFSNSLDEFGLHGVNLKLGVDGSVMKFGAVNEGLDNGTGAVVLDASIFEHISLENSHAFI